MSPFVVYLLFNHPLSWVLRGFEMKYNSSDGQPQWKSDDQPQRNLDGQPTC